MSQTVIGVFATNNQAQEAVQELKSSGFDSAAIDISSRENYNDANLRDRDGKVNNFFENLFGSDDQENYRNYGEAARRGSVVTVHTEAMPKAERAADILDQYGAIDANQATTKLRERGIAYEDNAQTLEVIKEDLHVGKTEVETGGVRLRSRIVERPVEETLRLREEEIVVNRTPVDRAATSADFDAMKEGSVTMTTSAERAVVDKSARVVEEVSLDKNVTEHIETIQDTVRETEVDVERIAGNAKDKLADATRRNA